MVRVLQGCSVAAGDGTHFFLRFRLSTAGSSVRQSQNSLVFVQYILMFAKPLKFYHKPHRWVWGMIGKLPK